MKGSERSERRSVFAVLRDCRPHTRAGGSSALGSGSTSHEEGCFLRGLDRADRSWSPTAFRIHRGLGRSGAARIASPLRCSSINAAVLKRFRILLRMVPRGPGPSAPVWIASSSRATLILQLLGGSSEQHDRPRNRRRVSFNSHRQTQVSRQVYMQLLNMFSAYPTD